MNGQIKVLIVEDAGFFRRALAMVLEKTGFVSVEAQNGHEALTLSKSEQPSVILLDLMMPKLNGVSTLRALRGNPETRDIPVVMLTADQDRATRNLAHSLGVAAFISKEHLDINVLTDALRASAQKRASSSATSGVINSTPHFQTA
jgi:CheY-like chemotaxis protein